MSTNRPWLGDEPWRGSERPVAAAREATGEPGPPEKPSSPPTQPPDRAAARTTLQRETGQLEALLSSLAVPLIELDRELRIGGINAAFAASFEVAPEAVAGERLDACLPSRLAATVEAESQVAMEAEELLLREVSDPETVTAAVAWRCHFLPRYASSGAVDGVRVAFQEANQTETDPLGGTERAASRPERDAADTLSPPPAAARPSAVEQAGASVPDVSWRRLLNSLFTFAAVCTPEGQLVEVNQPALQIAGLDPEDVLGKPFDQTFWFAHDEAVRHQVRAALDRAARGEGARFDVELQVGPQQLAPFDLQVVPLHDEAGQVIGLLPSAIDISDRKRFENWLKEARARADAANQSKSEFLANMSHEIRTPMTAILGYAELLSLQLKRSDNRKLVNTIRQNGQYLLEIISDILDLSKIESGKLDVQQLDIDLPRFVRELQSLMKLRAEEKGLEFCCLAGSPLPQQIRTDPVRLRQILINLIGNAIKFTAQGAVRVHLIFEPATSLLRFAVQDTGIGIEEANHALIFEPFSQVDASDTRAAGGTGLGLAISHRLAQSLHGRISMTSQFGKGSTFTLEIQLPPSQQPPLDPESWARASSCVPEPAEPPQATTLACHVLVVDDRREIRFLAQRFIEAAGGSVITAVDGMSALEVIKAAEKSDQPFDLVLTDIQMPKMDGYALTRRLRQAGFRLPIIVLTAHATQQDFEKCLQVGCDAFLSKPLKKEEFLRLIRRYTSELGLEEIELARTQRAG